VDDVRYPDQQVLGETPLDHRVVQKLLDRTSGPPSCTVSWIRTPAGGGSPEGLHVHDVDQIFYILSGIMTIELGGRVSIARPGGLVVFPAGTPHRNWNESGEPTVHLAISAPAPDPDKPFARPARHGREVG
jgi:mannose-6-phosphate isomerase-like protein (cupin superfamily)